MTNSENLEGAAPPAIPNVDITYDQWYKWSVEKIPGTLTSEQIEVAEGVTNWQPIGITPSIPLEEAEAVGRGKKKCPCCFGTGQVFVEAVGVAVDGDRVRDTGKRANYGVQCRCAYLLLFFTKWFDDRLVPERFRWVKLSRLVPSLKLPNISLETQRILIKTVKYKLRKLRESDEALGKDKLTVAGPSFLLQGPAGTGKTTIATAIYREMLSDWAWNAYKSGKVADAVWRMTAQQLLSEAHKASIDQEFTPTITRGKIINAKMSGHRPCLLLEEIDKFSPNDFRRNSFFEIINVIYEQNGMLIATSNMDEMHLMEHLGGVITGNPIIRRFVEEPGCILRFADSK